MNKKIGKVYRVNGFHVCIVQTNEGEFYLSKSIKGPAIKIPSYDKDIVIWAVRNSKELKARDTLKSYLDRIEAVK